MFLKISFVNQNSTEVKNWLKRVISICLVTSLSSITINYPTKAYARAEEEVIVAPNGCLVTLYRGRTKSINCIGARQNLRNKQNNYGNNYSNDPHIIHSPNTIYSSNIYYQHEYFLGSDSCLWVKYIDYGPNNKQRQVEGRVDGPCPSYSAPPRMRYRGVITVPYNEYTVQYDPRWGYVDKITYIAEYYGLTNNCEVAAYERKDGGLQRKAARGYVGPCPSYYQARVYPCINNHGGHVWNPQKETWELTPFQIYYNANNQCKSP